MRRAKSLKTRTLIATLGTAFVLTGCDPGVRDTVLSGVSAASTSLGSTFIQAFFESLAADDNSDPNNV